MKKKISDVVSPSGIFIIEINTISQNNQWILDTDYGSHLCINMKGLRNDRRLNKGELDLHVGNRASVAQLALGIYVSNLHSGLFLKKFG